jgi:hypothetical protein
MEAILKEMDGLSKPVAEKAAVAVPERSPSSTAWSKGEAIWFDELGVGHSLGHEPQDMAVRRAKDDALAKAMRKATDVFYGFSDYSRLMGDDKYESVARFLFTSSQGVLADEEAGKPECSVTDGVTTCKLLLRGKIVFRGSPDPTFLILDQAAGQPLGLDRRQYNENEDVKLKLSVSTHSFLYVFSWDAKDDIYLVYPNRAQRQNFLKGGEVAQIPAEGGGLAYKAVLPKGAVSASERLLIIAAKKELLGEESIPALGDYASFNLGKLADIMRRLAQLDRQDWTMQVLPYEILAKK